jgi:hypothetical protein
MTKHELEHDSLNNPIITCEECRREFEHRNDGKEEPLSFSGGSSSLKTKMKYTGPKHE